MKNKIVLITGANGGLGNAVTEAFLNAGAIVAGASRQISQDEFKNPNFYAFPAELSSLAAAKKLADEVVQRCGKIDVLVHLIGAFAAAGTIGETDDATWQKMLDLNLNSTFHLVRAVLPHIRKSRGGRILAIGSRMALEPQAGIGAYQVSKAALVSLVRTLALENKDLGITANIVLPDTMDTPANRAAMPKADTSKWVQPGAVANLLVALAGPAGAAVSGAVIPVYGPNL
jgi:NAD(P)-dependent dehydrogenase (short-subunit alcohol dehydrogenase family)